MNPLLHRLKSNMTLSLILFFLTPFSLFQQGTSEVNFPVFIQYMEEGDSIVYVDLTFSPKLESDGWVKIIQEVSSTVDFQNDLLFENPHIVYCSSGDSTATFTIGIFDDDLIETTEIIMLAIESTSEFIETGPDGEHVVFIDDNDCVLSIENLDSLVCNDSEPFELIGYPAGGEFSGPGIGENNLFNPAQLDTGSYLVSYFVEMENMCVDTLFHEVEVTACETTGLTDIDQEATISIFPNPATSTFNVDLRENTPGQLWVFDISGKLVQTADLNNGTNRIISPENSGLYFLKIKVGENIISNQLAVLDH